MIKIQINSSKVFELLNVVNSEFENRDFYSISDPHESNLDSIYFLRDTTDVIVEKNNLYITEKGQAEKNVILVKNSRLAMAKILSHLKADFNIGTNSFIHASAVISEDVFIGNSVYIGENCYIGRNCIIKSNVVINNNVVIKDNCIIRENSVIGGDGFGVEKDENGNNVKIHHYGGVIIENNVEVGALNTIVSGTLKPTRIGAYTKIDDHVHIAHNNNIGENCIITAGVILSGSVTTGNNVWIGPNSTIINSATIGNDVQFGIGAVGTKKSYKSYETFVGNPAVELSKFIEERKKIKGLINNNDQ